MLTIVTLFICLKHVMKVNLKFYIVTVKVGQCNDISLLSR